MFKFKKSAIMICLLLCSIYPAETNNNRPADSSPAIRQVDPMAFHYFNQAKKRIIPGRVVHITGIGLVVGAQIMAGVFTAKYSTNRMELIRAASLTGLAGMITYNVGLPIMGSASTRMSRASSMIHPDGYYHNPWGWITYGIGWGLSLTGFGITFASALMSSEDTFYRMALAGSLINLTGIGIKAIVSWILFEVTAARNYENIMLKTVRRPLSFRSAVSLSGAVLGCLDYSF